MTVMPLRWRNQGTRHTETRDSTGSSRRRPEQRLDGQDNQTSSDALTVVPAPIRVLRGSMRHRSRAPEVLCWDRAAARARLHGVAARCFCGLRRGTLCRAGPEVDSSSWNRRSLLRPPAYDPTSPANGGLLQGLGPDARRHRQYSSLRWLEEHAHQSVPSAFQARQRCRATLAGNDSAALPGAAQSMWQRYVEQPG